MKALIQQAIIIDRTSPFHGKQHDILIENGVITRIASSIEAKDATVIHAPGLHVSTGWVDFFAQMGDPGLEHKETLISGANAAAAGGYIHVCVLPNTRPVIDNKTQVEYIRNKSRDLPVNIYPLGAVTQKCEGKELAEMYDMYNAGATAFTDGLHPIQNAGLLVKALQYVKAIQGTIIQMPDDTSIGTHGLMHEGLVSTRLGLPGKPVMAEELMIARDIKLARYAGSKIHFTGVTSPKSLEYIRRAKESGVAVTCSVTPYHLFLNETVMETYDSNYKVFPPLRPQPMADALKEALKDGTIDCITTHHLPHEYDSKALEFEYAKAGMTGLETAYSVLKTAVPEISEERWVELLSVKPAALMGISLQSIQEGNKAVLTLFQPAETVSYNREHMQSKSTNTPFTGQTLQGKVYGIINGLHTIINL